MAWHPLAEPKAGHFFVEKQLLAMQLPATNPGSATATVEKSALETAFAAPVPRVRIPFRNRSESEKER
jgi:hypothetical protein